MTCRSRETQKIMNNMEKTFEHQSKGRWHRRKQKKERKAKTLQMWKQTDYSDQTSEELCKNERKALEHEENALQQKEHAILKSENVFRHLGNEQKAQENLSSSDLLRSVQEWERRCEADAWERLGRSWRSMDADEVDPASSVPKQVYLENGFFPTKYDLCHVFTNFIVLVSAKDAFTEGHITFSI